MRPPQRAPRGSGHSRAGGTRADPPTLLAPLAPALDGQRKQPRWHGRGAVLLGANGERQLETAAFHTKQNRCFSSKAAIRPVPTYATRGWLSIKAAEPIEYVSFEVV